jgi:hypothetical protein
MADICNSISKNIQTSICATSGGTSGRQWVFQKHQFTGASTNATSGALASFALKSGEKGIKANGRAKKGSGASDVSTGDNGSVSNAQTVVSVFKYNTENEANAIMEFLRAEGKVIFQETAKGTIRVYFWQFGSEGGSATDGTGTVLTDDNDSVTATITGNEPNLPRFFEATPTGGETVLAASIAYLDALVQADA